MVRDSRNRSAKRAFRSCIHRIENRSGRKQMHRRAFLTATAAVATAATLQAAHAATERPFGATGVPLAPTRPLPLGPLPGSRYPDPHIESLDKRFKGSAGTGAVERLATGFRWAEGPVYFPAGRYLLFSDIPNNRIMRLSEDDNHLSVFRQPSMNSNGNTIDREGRLVTCEHGGRRVTRTELDGTITIIADTYNGKKLNAPNDVAVAANGSIWFTDPGYGIKGDYEGLMEPFEQDKRNVFRVDPKSGDIKVVVDDFVMPNGIAFSPDEKKLYVIDTGLTEGRTIRRTSACSTSISTPAGCRTARCSPTTSGPGSPMECVATPTATSGAPWDGPTRRRTGFAATPRTGPCSARSTCRKPSPT
jgi:gluconolactonase